MRGPRSRHEKSGSVQSGNRKRRFGHGAAGRKNEAAETCRLRRPVASHRPGNAPGPRNRRGQAFFDDLRGPPGSGKTTLARILATETKTNFVSFSAVLSGVREIRQVIDDAKELWEAKKQKTILFVDEIHRFNKAQQDAFLPHVESGLVTLIGATTENPSFEVIAPLLSRTRVLALKQFTEEDLAAILRRALADEQRGLGRFAIQAQDGAIRYLAGLSDGDARTALNNLEAAASMVQNLPAEERILTEKAVEEALLKKAMLYDKDGEEHYNLISAFHKSMRGSDPDATLYWLGRMLAAGEDPLYILRRMVRFASETWATPIPTP